MSGTNALENGLTLVQQNPDCAVDFTGGRTHGWLFVRGPDGQWVAHHKLTSAEYMQAEDMRDYGIIQDGSEAA